MNYHLILTDACNLSCSYCRGRMFLFQGSGARECTIDEDLPEHWAGSLDCLSSFLSRDPDATLTFYGGEPLLRVDLVTAVMERVPAKKFLLHTNGTRLHLLSRDILKRLDTISISLDGSEALTDRYRGKGVYQIVMHNIRYLTSQGFSGELIARMTVSEYTDIRESVRYLTSNPDHQFFSIHWQIDADFSEEGSWQNFKRWVTGSYNPGIRDLIHDWVDWMEEHGEVLRWYPFIDPLQDLLLNRNSLLRCGCGHASYSIMTNGAITPCPIMVGMKEQYVGHITTSDPLTLSRISINGSCTQCDIRDFCGGRCLYASIVHAWSPRQRELVCGTVRTLREELFKALPRVQHLIASGRIHVSQFDHPRFNGCEIIP